MMEQARLSSALQRFKELYGDGEAQAIRAPARINILGEHVDYVSYLPTASLAFGSREHEMLMLFRATDDGRVRGASTLEKFLPFGFALDEEEIEDHTKQTWESFVFNMMYFSHESLRRFYGVSTPRIERLIKIINADPQVYGARLMGGGFGGSVLALTTAENTQALIDRVQNEFYGPRGRDGLAEGSVMVSTPGNGLEFLRLE